MVSIGYGAAKALTTGGGIVAIGYNALGAATTGGFSTAIGYMAGNVANGVSLTLVGYLAGTATTGSYNTLIGALAGQSMTTAGANTAVGYGALQTPAGIVGNATTTASNQTAVGRDSGAYSAGTGNEIVAVGYYAVANSDGVAIGSRAQAQGSNSVALGKSAVATVNNQIMLGAATHRVYVNNDPTADLEVATKRYVDTAASTGNEVAVQDTDPGLAFDIWYDKDAPDTAAVGVLPPGGTAGQFLTKATDVDYAVAWRTVVLPAAAMTQWMGTGVIPSGWLLCDGSAVSRTTYSLLYAAVGTAYGTGDGSTTFNLPNLKGRVPAGLDAAQTEFDALAKTGGANTVTLSAAQIPAHTHTTPAHDHTVYTRDYDFGAAPASGGDHVAFGATVATPRWSNLGSPDGGGTTGSAGSNVSHLNLQPYIVVRYIISTGGQ
jgi:microcystin-dependent protein